MIPMSNSTRERGAEGEALAAAYLEHRGLTVIARNLACKAGELDLVCLHRDILVIVEVRLRARSDFGGALASVTRAKQRKLVRAAQYHWQRIPDWRTRRMRFDVIAIQGGSTSGPLLDIRRPSICWIKDAFRAT
jgi:putative endonuclease